MNEEKKVNSSIVFKLNTWHLKQVFLSFLWINIIITMFFSGAILYHTEWVINDKIDTISQQDLVVQEPGKGIKLPDFIENLLPPNLKNSTRSFVIESWGNTFWDKVNGLKYKVWVPIDDAFYVFEANIGVSFTEFLKMMILLVIFQLLFFIGSIGKGYNAMKQALRPIAELTKTARIINSTPSMQSMTQISDLKGTIDTINATRLDTRISISSNQNELKDLAGAINKMLERINDAYRSQVRFVSDASHELRTPIAVIQGYANLLDRWGKNDEKALDESIKAIKSEAEGMKALVEQLLFLARGDNDTMHLTLEDINLSDLVSDVLRETIMIDQSHEFSSKVSENVVIVGDIQLIKQAIRIFIDNSIKYTPAGESISVSTMRDGDYGKIIVQDNGIGIPAEDVPHVFDRFFRSDDSRARKTGGTGLGLSIAKWIIDRHGGTVEILSRKDIGTRISISLKCK